jgi:hypothetical protein
VLASVLAWVAGAALAVAVGMLALSSIGGGRIPDALQPAPPDSVIQDVPGRPGAASATRSAAGSASPTPRPSRSQAGPAPSTTGAKPPGSSRRVISTSAGSIVVECRSSQAYLVSWSPEPGYSADKVRRGPAEVVSVRLRAPGEKVDLAARCVDGIPQRVGGGNGHTGNDG